MHCQQSMKHIFVSALDIPYRTLGQLNFSCLRKEIKLVLS